MRISDGFAAASPITFPGKTGKGTHPLSCIAIEPAGRTIRRIPLSFHGLRRS